MGCCVASVGDLLRVIVWGVMVIFYGLLFGEWWEICYGLLCGEWW
jgi:hypothetical protein